MAINVDQVLEEIGGFQKYQLMLLFIFGYVAFTIDNFPIMIVTFITAEPDWVCVIGNNSQCNFTEPISLTSDDYMARCSMPRENWTYAEGFTSTVTEYDLVCDKSYLQSVAQSCSRAGIWAGLLVSGYLSDRFGRKRIFYFGVVGIVVATWVMAFPKYFAVFMAGRLVSGLTSGFLITTYFVIMAEYTSEKYRAKLCLSLWYFWVFSMLILALLAYLIREWRYLLLASAVLATPCLLLWWITPESARWLLVHGKEKKARAELAKVARINKKSLPKDDLTKPQVTESHGNLIHLFQNWKVAKTTLICWNIWISIALVYYGVSFGSVDLGWNRYLTFALTSLVELPSDYTAIFSADRYGRKRSVIVGLVVSCAASVVAISIPPDQSNTGFTAGRVLAAAVAKFFINLAFAATYIWTAELFPTFVRSMAVSTSSASGSVGSFAASYVIWLIRIHPLLPYGIMAFVSLQAAILATLLPETRGQATLETMKDMENDGTVVANKTNVNASDGEDDSNVKTDYV